MNRQINYEDYRKLIASRAWAWSKRTGWDVQELIAEGNLAFVLALAGFDPQKACFSTYLYHCLQTHFSGLVSKQRALESDEDVEPNSLPSQDGCPERMAALREMLDHLSCDARILAECVLETPRALVWMLGDRGHKVKVTRYALQRYFVGRREWRISRVWKAFREIKLALNTL